jgi:hypothetical protein
VHLALDFRRTLESHSALAVLEAWTSEVPTRDISGVLRIIVIHGLLRRYKVGRMRFNLYMATIWQQIEHLYVIDNHPTQDFHPPALERRHKQTAQAEGFSGEFSGIRAGACISVTCLTSRDVQAFHL